MHLAILVTGGMQLSLGLSLHLCQLMMPLNHAIDVPVLADAVALDSDTYS
jgi:hypothetical protein